MKAHNDSHALPRFRDINSTEIFYTDSEVSVVWPYKPQNTDEFALDQGDMLRILSIYDDGWALGYRLGERAGQWRGITPTRTERSLIVKAFPLVCVTVSREWKKFVKLDSKTRRSA